MPATKNTRFDHSNCKHARSGAEGKKARAACRKAHAEAAKKAETKTRTTSPRTKRATRKEPVSVPVSVTKVDELDDADL